ncbi:MAG: hypothetical protein IIA60_08675, partial [Candidatus Marinimicrobia bacterium]|nr:hypothetical protein [Candidatus Neomarinimicrobiota bacterium]
LKLSFVKRMSQVLDAALETEQTIPAAAGPPEEDNKQKNGEPDAITAKDVLAPGRVEK